MRRVAFGLAILLAVTLVTPGCLGGGSSVQQQSVEGHHDLGTAGNSSVNATQNATPPAPTWNVTYRNGSVSGIAFLGFSDGVSSEPFNVTAGMGNLTLNITSKGSGVNVIVYPPGCNPPPNPPSCAITGTADGATPWSWSTTNPAAGQWNVNFYYNGTGLGTSPYGLRIALLEPAPATS